MDPTVQRKTATLDTLTSLGLTDGRIKCFVGCLSRVVMQESVGETGEHEQGRCTERTGANLAQRRPPPQGIRNRAMESAETSHRD